MINPYNYNLPVTPKMFFGRHQQVALVAQRLLAPQGDSFALIGGPRMGKTSFLEALQRQLIETSRNSITRVYPVQFDLSAGEIKSEQDFFELIFDLVNDQWGTPRNQKSHTGSRPISHWFSQWLADWSRAKIAHPGHTIRLILLLDGCEQIVDKVWTNQLYKALRSILINAKTRNLFKVVLTGSQHFLHQVEQDGSPLRNILIYEKLHPFDNERTRALITDPQILAIDKSIVQTITDASGGHPFLTQYLLHSLWNLGMEQVTVSDVHTIAEQFPRHRSDFSNWYDNWSPSSQSVYEIIAQSKTVLNHIEIRAAMGKSSPYNLAQALDTLHYYGIIQEVGKRTYWASSAMFRQWFRENHLQASDKLLSRKTISNTFNDGYALLIGVGADLPVTVHDAKGIYNILTDSTRCAYPPEQVKLLTETEATRANILKELDWMIEQTRRNPQAVALIYFSGHGGISSQYHLVPNQYDPNNIAETAILGSEFSAKIKEIQAKKVLVLLDCCHASGMAEVKSFIKSPIPSELETVLGEGKGRIVIASCQKDQVSYIGSPYSVFTQSLREALAGAGAAEQDGYAYVTDIALYVNRTVSQRTRNYPRGEQNPVFKIKEADNFAVAYYAAGEKMIRALPQTSLEEEQAHDVSQRPNGQVALDIITKRHQQQLAEMLEEFDAVCTQLSGELDPQAQIRLKRQQRQLELKIKKTRLDLDQN